MRFIAYEGKRESVFNLFWVLSKFLPYGTVDLNSDYRKYTYRVINESLSQ